MTSLHLALPRSIFTVAVLSLLLLSVFSPTTNASPVRLELEKRQSITTLSQAQIDAFTPYTHYAAAGYCDPSTTLTWSCGTHCTANAGFQPTASGGNGADVQFWYVGYDPNLKTVIVGHQGTDGSKIIPLINDADFFLTPLGFSGLSSDIEVHSGFKESQGDTADDVLNAVQQTMSQKGTNSVMVVGHSLGAAIAMLDAVYLDLKLPSATVSMTGYGTPRVGNQAFADYVDAHIGSLARVNNQEDPVPILPGRFLGFHHPSGERHIKDDNSWVACPGEDNTSDQCTTGLVSNIFEGDTGDHDGPYNGITMGC